MAAASTLALHGLGCDDCYITEACVWHQHQATQALVGDCIYIYDLCKNLPETDAAIALLGFMLLAMLTFFKKWKQAGNEAKRSKSLIWRFFPKNKDSYAFKSMKMCADLSSVLCVILGWVWGYIYRQTGINLVRLIDDSESNGFIFLLPSFDSNTPDLIVPALMIAVVGFLETMAVGKMANEKRFLLRCKARTFGGCCECWRLLQDSQFHLRRKLSTGALTSARGYCSG